MTDPFVWEGEEYIFLAASDVYTLFDPKVYGLEPKAPHTACWKGFIIHFSVKRDQLYLDKLEVNCENNIYPPINEIRVEEVSEREDFRIYNGLNIPLEYSGTVIVGKNLKDRFKGQAFTGPYSYDETHELVFEKGILLDYIETSGTYHGF